MEGNKVDLEDPINKFAVELNCSILGIEGKQDLNSYPVKGQPNRKTNSYSRIQIQANPVKTNRPSCRFILLIFSSKKI